MRHEARCDGGQLMNEPRLPAYRPNLAKANVREAMRSDEDGRRLMYLRPNLARA